MKNPVTGLGLPQQKEMFLERGQLHAFPVKKRQGDEYHWLEADLLNLAAGPLGCWGHEGKVSGGAKCELWLWRAVPLLGERVFAGTL